MRMIRTHLGLSQADMAAKLGLSRSNLNHYERNVFPSIQIVVEIATQMHLTLDVLILQDLSKASVLDLRTLLYDFTN